MPITGPMAPSVHHRERMVELEEKIARRETDGHKKKKRRRVRHGRRLGGRFMFTDNRHPSSGILSVILGVLALTGIIVAIVRTWRGGGTAGGTVTIGALLCALYAVAGLALGIRARFSRNVFLIFPKLGIFFNTVAIISLAGLYYLGW